MEPQAALNTRQTDKVVDSTKNVSVVSMNDLAAGIKPPTYSVDELAYWAGMIFTLQQARDQRDRCQPELDMMSYIEYYESNRKKDLSFIPPKKNKQDVRIVTGLTREKDTTLLNALLNMNLTPDITAFDSDDMIVNELGDNMSDMVKKSREIEDWYKKRSIIYREMIAQGDVFVEEVWTEEYRNLPTSEIDWDPTKEKIVDFSSRERLTKIKEECSSRMVNGKKIYLGNIRCTHVEDQPLVAVLNIYNRSTAKSIYGQWDRWANVPYAMDNMTTFWNDGTTYHDWNLVSLNAADRVCEIKIYDKDNNRFMIMLNGVLMLPINYPLTAISPSGEIPFAQGKLEPISDFAYSKSQPSKTKIDQEVLDEATRLMIEKTRQSFKPPMGNIGKKVYSGNVFLAGQITSDVTPSTFFPILPQGYAYGVQPAEFNFYKMIKESIDEKTSDPSFGGDTGSDGPMTATETVEQKNQQMMQLGLSLDGIVNLERRMTWNRIQNILVNWTKEMCPCVDDVNQAIYDNYKTFGVSSTVDDGQAGVRLFRQTTKQFPSVEDHQDEENALSKKHGQPVRITYLNPKMLREAKYKWFILINPAPKSNDKLTQLMFVQNLQQAMMLFGPQAINAEYAKQRFAIICNEDYTKLFAQGSVAGMATPPTMGPNGQQTQPGGQQTGAIPPIQVPGMGMKSAPMAAAMSAKQ